MASFGDTLSLAMRMSLIVMVPAMVGLLVLATPIAALLYQRGQFTPLDTTYTARAVIGYAPQLPLLAMLQLLVYAFYARHNTLTPTLAGVAGVGIYVALALVLFRFTIVGLAFADTIAVAAQMLVMLVVVRRAIGFSDGKRLTETVVKVTIAGVAMAAAAGLATRVLGPMGTGIGARLADVAIPGIIGLVVYGGVIVALRVDEARLVMDMLRRRIRT
jgi:putative peptidoglycan lipid II flippase